MAKTGYSAVKQVAAKAPTAYWYKINGKTTTKAGYNAYTNKPGGDEGGKTTNDPDASGNKAKTKKARSKVAPLKQTAKKTTLNVKKGSAADKKKKKTKTMEDYIAEGFTPADARRMMKDGAVTGKQGDSPVKGIFDKIKGALGGVAKGKGVMGALMNPVGAIGNATGLFMKSPVKQKVDPDAPGTPGTPGYEPPVKRSDLDAKGKAIWDRNHAKGKKKLNKKKYMKVKRKLKKKTPLEMCGCGKKKCNC